MSTITIDRIEAIVAKLLSKLKKENINNMTFEDDNYWNVSIDDMCKFPKEPELTIGSINDDIDFLNSLIDENYETHYLELEKLAAVLKFAAKKLI